MDFFTTQNDIFLENIGWKQKHQNYSKLNQFSDEILKTNPNSGISTEILLQLPILNVIDSKLRCIAHDKNSFVDYVGTTNNIFFYGRGIVDRSFDFLCNYFLNPSTMCILERKSDTNSANYNAQIQFPKAALNYDSDNHTFGLAALFPIYKFGVGGEGWLYSFSFL